AEVLFYLHSGSDFLRHGNEPQKAQIFVLFVFSFCAFCVLSPASSARDVHFQSRRPVLEFVRVIQIRTASGTGVRPWNGGNEAQRNLELVFRLEVAPVEDDFPADDFVGIDLAGLDQFLELIVPDFQTTWNSHDGHRSGDRLIALVGDGYDGFGDTSFLNLRILKNDLKPDLRFAGRVEKQAVVLDADRERHTRTVSHLERNRVLAGYEVTGEIRHDERSLVAGREGERSAEDLAVDTENDPAWSFGPGVRVVIGNNRAQCENGGLCRAEAAALVGFDDPLQSLLDLSRVRRVTHPGKHGKRRRLNRQSVAARARNAGN